MYNVCFERWSLLNSAAIFTRCASPPESVVADCPSVTPIGYGVLSESELLERITVVTQPDADRLVPSTTQYVPNLSLR